MRTVRSYSLLEKAMSAFLAGLMLFSLWMGFFGGYSSSSKNVYVEGVVGKIMVLNPLFSNYGEADRDVSSLIFSGLMKYDSSTGKMAEDLAKLSLNADPVSYTHLTLPTIYSV